MAAFINFVHGNILKKPSVSSKDAESLESPEKMDGYIHTAL